MPVRVLSLFLSQDLLAVFHGRFLVDVLFFGEIRSCSNLYLIHKFHAMFAILIPTIVSMYKMSYILQYSKLS